MPASEPAAAAARAEEREKVLVEEKAEDEQDDRPAASDRRAADAESAKSAAARSAPVFNVAAVTARCPSHTERDYSTLRANAARFARGCVAQLSARSRLSAASSSVSALRACRTLNAR